jgi:ATP/maltotriose-dependent transcriptional regulator MalT
MRSRLLARLDAAIARTRDPVQLACLRAERAGFLGRHGQVELARGQIQEIQRQFARQPHVAVSAWIALAEGQVEQYLNLGSATAHDRLKRAYALSAAGGLQPLHALSAAWLGHAHYLQDDYERMATLCAEALRLAAPDHHAARWRAALTTAVAYHYAGRLDLAQPWYNAARGHALDDGDEVALSAVLYNQAGLRADHARQSAAFGSAGGSDAVHAAMGVDSAGNLDAGLGIQSLDWLVPLLRAQLLVLEGRFGAALALIDEHGQRLQPGWRERMHGGLLAERAWCLLQLGREDEAREETTVAAEQLQAGASEVDDRALAHARLAQLYGHFGDAEAAAAHQALAQRHRADYLAQQAKVLRTVQQVLGEVAPD